MCLVIYSSKAKEKNNKQKQKFIGKAKKFKIVYKVVHKFKHEDFYRSFYYPNFIWNIKNQKVFQVDRNNEPTDYELKYGEINKGFHVYTSLEIAKRNKGLYFHEILKFAVPVQNIVAVNSDDKEAVCNKLIFVKEVK